LTRLQTELLSKTPYPTRPEVFASNDRQLMSWIGGAIITSISSFQSMWITQTDYQENGPSIIYRNCL
jgi:actin-related protein